MRYVGESSYFLSAFVGQGKSFQAVTSRLSFDAWNSAIQRDPIVLITLSINQTVDTVFLVDEMERQGRRFWERTREAHRARTRWKYFSHQNLEPAFQFERVLEASDVHAAYLALVQQLESEKPAVSLLISELLDFDEGIQSAIAKAIISPSVSYHSRIDASSTSRYKKGSPQNAPLPHRASPAPPARHVQPDKQEPSYREQLLQARKEILDKVGSLSSEEVAIAADSTSTNASQTARDQREAGKIFGVRFGKHWHYPKFQFDAKGRIVPEMKAVLASLAPDPHGWDRLQWFLTPHESLKGRAPFDVWHTDRSQVVKAASIERWDGRD